MVNIEKLSITQVDTITAFNNADQLEFIMDEVQDCTLAQEEEIVDITGRGGRKIGSLKKNKAVTGNGTNGLITGGALAAMLGGDVETGKSKVRFNDTELVVSGNSVTITKEPVGTTGAEIIGVYVMNKDGSVDMSSGFTQNAQTGSKQFTYSNKKITFAANTLEDGATVVAIYDIEVDSAKVSNESDKYSKTLCLYIDCTAQDTCDNQYHVQFKIPRADFHGTFDIAMGSDPSTLAYEFAALAGGCSGSTNLWDMVVFA